MTKEEALEVKFYFEEITEVEAALDMISNDKTASLENIAPRLAGLARARFSRPHLHERTRQIVEQCVDLIDKDCKSYCSIWKTRLKTNTDEPPRTRL